MSKIHHTVAVETSVALSSPNIQLPIFFQIAWTRDGRRWCEKKIEFSGPIPEKPNHIGIHFFPDGTIEAEITEEYPEVKLKLKRDFSEQRKSTGNTINDERTATCTSYTE